MLLQIEGGVVAPRGFRAGGCYAGICAEKKRADLAMVVSDLPAACAGVYTKNAFSAPSVRWSSFITSQYGMAQVVLLNSAVSNALTGDEGYDATVRAAAQTAGAVGVPQEAVLMSSCGEAGMLLPADAVALGAADLFGKLGNDDTAGQAAAEAFADEVFAQIAVEFDLGDKKARIGAMCSGGEAISAVFTTDAAIEQSLLAKALTLCVEESFAMLGRTSAANDCVFVLANGMAGNRRLQSEDDDLYETFCTALSHAALYLARRVAPRKAGGLLEVAVTNAAEKADAVLLARKIALAASVPACIPAPAHILHLLGESGVRLDPVLTDVVYKSSVGTKQAVRNGILLTRMPSLKPLFCAPSVFIGADLKNGNASAVAFGAFSCAEPDADFHTEE